MPSTFLLRRNVAASSLRSEPLLAVDGLRQRRASKSPRTRRGSKPGPDVALRGPCFRRFQSGVSSYHNASYLQLHLVHWEVGSDIDVQAEVHDVPDTDRSGSADGGLQRYDVSAVSWPERRGPLHLANADACGYHAPPISDGTRDGVNIATGGGRNTHEVKGRGPPPVPYGAAEVERHAGILAGGVSGCCARHDGCSSQ